MISILGDYSYTFPKPIPLKLKLKDMLEDEVDEKYYLSDKMIDFYIFNTEKQKENGNGFKFEPITKDEAKICKTITTRSGSRMDDNYITNKPLRETLEKYAGKIVKVNQFIDGYNRTIRDDDLSCTLSTRVDASNNNFLLVKNATKKGYLEATNGDGIDLAQPNSETRRGRVQKDAIQTLTTQNNLGVVNDLKIRKLTPKECFRLMGVKDEDFDKVSENQSDSSLYHLAGDSIVVNILCEIFKQLLQ